MKEDNKKKGLTEQRGKRKGRLAERQKDRDGELCWCTAGRLSSATGREETDWGRRVRRSTREHKYLIEARLTREQRAQSLPPNTVPFPQSRREAGKLWFSLRTNVVDLSYLLYG